MSATCGATPISTGSWKPQGSRMAGTTTPAESSRPDLGFEPRQLHQIPLQLSGMSDPADAGVVYFLSIPVVGVRRTRRRKERSGTRGRGPRHRRVQRRQGGRPATRPVRRRPAGASYARVVTPAALRRSTVRSIRLVARATGSRSPARADRAVVLAPSAPPIVAAGSPAHATRPGPT